MVHDPCDVGSTSERNLQRHPRETAEPCPEIEGDHGLRLEARRRTTVKNRHSLDHIPNPRLTFLSVSFLAREADRSIARRSGPTARLVLLLPPLALAGL
jgi:hypothetical protein